MVKNCQEVRGAKCKANTGHIFLDQFLGIDADHFAAGIEQWAAAVAGIDGRVGLNPGARPGSVEAANGADDSFGNAEKHGITGIADGQHAFSLSHRPGLGKRKMREVFAGRFRQSNIKLGIDVHNPGFQLRAIRQGRD